MENGNKAKLFEEQLRKYKHRIAYKVNESPRYQAVIADGEEFDSLPLTNEAGEQEDAPNPEGRVPTQPSNDPVPADPTSPPAPEGQPTPAEPPVPAFDNDPQATMGGAPQDPQAMGGQPQQVDDIQNEIIKHNIEAMKSIRDQLEMLNNMTQGLSAKVDNLNASVEEVREPTNVEKLMKKTEVSHPYYYNLNDFWSGNWFSEQRAKENNAGIRELPDGTFVADFDDLPQKSKQDVQDSYNVA